MKRAVMWHFVWFTLLNFTLASSCAGSNMPANYSDPAQAILVGKNNPQFTITLAANPTTGYTWYLVNYDKSLLTLVKHAYQTPAKNLPGAGGMAIWTFKVKTGGFTAPQMSKITLLYARPWNLKDNSTQVEFTIVTY